jgi:hypothetical protein
MRTATRSGRTRHKGDFKDWQTFLFIGPDSQSSSPERHLRQPHFSPTPLHEKNFYVLDVDEVRPRKYKRGVDPISDKLPFVESCS